MATLTYTFGNVSLVSRWSVQVNSANGKLYFSQNPTQANRSISFDVTGLAAGAIINSAKLSFSAGSPSTGAALFRYKNNQTGTYTNLSTGKTNSIDIPLTGNGTVSGELQFRAYGSKNQGLGSHSATLGISDIKLVIDYVAYTAPTAPTAVSVASTNVAPGATVQLSWSGATAGTSNPITGYHVHRATSASGSYSYLTEVSTSATSGSVNVTAPTTNGSSYYYKVYTKATQSDYLWSAASTAYATLTTKFTAPTAPTVKINNGTSAYAAQNINSAATLSWSGASAGTNNPIAGYFIYVNGNLYSEQGSNVSSLSIPSYAAGNHSWTVVTKGSYSNSSASTAVTLYSYSAPTAPTSVSIGTSYISESGSFSLSWSGAATGTNNSISGYAVYMDGSLKTSTNASTTTASISGAAVGEHSFYVITKGARSNSSASSTVKGYVYGKPGAPTSQSVASSVIDAGTTTTLSWSGAKAGTYNSIKSYKIKRSTSSSSIGNDLATIESTATSGSYSVAAPSRMGDSYYFYVGTTGARGYTIYNTTGAKLTAKTYTACSAPTSVSLAANNVAPSASVKLSWSGASAGTNNPITGYHIYRATSSDGTYSHVHSVSTTSTSGSYNVTAQSANNSTYYYKVYTIGTKSGYNSGASSAVSLTTKYTAPTAPTSITINDASSVYIAEGSTATLKWSGAAAGTNNAISGYLVYVGDSLYADVGSSTTSTSVPSYSGGEHKWKVVTKGAYSNSAASSTVSCFTYTATSAPTNVSLAATTVDAGASTTLSWSGAKAGTYNAITGYHVYRATSKNGAYSVLTAVESTSTAANTTVNAPSTMGSKYYYKVYTIGARNYNSGASSVVSLTAQTYSAPSAPTSLSLSVNNVAASATVTLSWSGAAAGTNNAITGYKVYRSAEQNGTYELLSTVNTTSTSGSLSVVAPSETSSAFYYKIITVGTKSGFTESTYSSTISLQTESAQPTPPTNLTVSKPYIYQASEQITLSWSESLGGDGAITGYNIYQASSRNSAYAKLATVSTSETSGSYTISLTEAATTYYFKVSTVGTTGESALSVPVTVIFSTFPNAPTNVIVSKTLSSGEAVALSWDAAVPGYQDSIKEYWIKRRESSDGRTWSQWDKFSASTTETSITVSPPETYGNYYLYEIRSLSTHNAVSDYVTSSNTLRRDHAPIVFAENITARETNVRAQHMTELQDTIAMLLEFYGLDAQTMSTITAGTTPLSSWTEHINEIRAAIDFLTTYHDEWLEIPVNVPRADIMNQLRNVLLYVEKPQCVLGIGKLGAMITR